MSSLMTRKVKKDFGHAKKADLHLLKKCIMNGVTALKGIQQSYTFTEFLLRPR
jgi:hypothetical protein